MVINPLAALFSGQLLVYDLGEGRLAPLLSEAGWCATCAGLMPIERLPGSGEIETIITRYQQSMENDKAGAGLRQLATRVLASADAWRRWQTTAADRQPRCLCCGATAAARVDTDATGTVKIGALHPGCGGSLCLPAGSALPALAPKARLLAFRADGTRPRAAAPVPIATGIPAASVAPVATSVAPAAQALTGGETALHQSPFWLLGVSVHDSRQRIVARCDELALTLDETVCRAARAALTNPRNRLAAELAWLPGLVPARALQLATQARDQAMVLVDRELPVLAQVNLLASTIEKIGGNTSQAALAGLIGRFCELIDSVSAADTLRVLNADRELAGFLAISDIELVDSGLKAQILAYCNSLKSLLDKQKSEKLIELLTTLVETATADNTATLPVQLGVLMNAFEVEAQVFLHTESENIVCLVDIAGKLISHDQTRFASIQQRIEALTLNWCRVARPVQLALVARGLVHQASESLLMAIRQLAIAAYNVHHREDIARQITTFLQKAFVVLPTLVERLDQDIEDIAGAIEKRRVDAVAWKQSVACEIKIGRRNLSITDNGVHYDDSAFTFEQLTHLRWSGMRRSINGIPTGTSFTFVWGNDRREQRLSVSGQKSYDMVVNALWKAVGRQLMMDLIASIAIGRTFDFGSARLNDEGIELLRHRTFGQGERQQVPWNLITIASSDGKLIIRKVGNSEYRCALAYADTPNLPILENAIKLVQQNKFTRMSALIT